MQPDTPKILPELDAFSPSLIIFDKDGTLTDFRAMWVSWIVELAQRLEVETGLFIRDRVFNEVGFDPVSGKIDLEGHLAVTPTGILRTHVVGVLQAAGLKKQAAEAAMTAAWFLPDSVALARPLTDLEALFSTLNTCGIRVAIATSDDCVTTRAMLKGLGIASLVDAVVCADDGFSIKPKPDMILAICRELDILPSRSVIVGDNVVDLQMGRAAGVGLTIGVLSGLGVAADLAPYADVILASIDKLSSVQARHG